MAVLSVATLVVAVAGAVLRPWRLPAWAVPLAAVVVDLAAGAIGWHAAHRAVSPLAAPIGFLLAAVPLAVLLDRLGFFSALAGRLIAAGGGTGSLWVLGALVITVFNLDAGVVLLTPLYVGIARRRGSDAFALAAQPVLLACLASSALPVSNLTNLIAQAETGAGTGAFLAHLGPASLAACAVGWWCYRRTFPAASTVAVAEELGKEGDRRPLVAGGAVVAVVLVGFTLGRSVGIDPWVVALGADVVLVAMVRQVPLRQVPLGTAVVALALGVLAAAAVGHLGLHHLIGGTDAAALARTTGVTALGANVVNNLPALLVALPAVGPHPSPALWSVLVGVNMGPVLLVTGSLASLLWLDTLGRLGVPARGRDFTWVGVRIGLPAALAGFGVQLALHGAGVG